MAQQFDVTMKLLLDRTESPVFDAMFGGPVVRWHNVEIPKVENKRPDMVAETASGRVHYLEIDASGKAALLPRTCRNYLALKDRFEGIRVIPTILHIGRGRPSLPCPFDEDFVTFRYKLIDARDLDGDALLDSPDVRDNILAILTPADRQRVVDTVLEKLAGIAPEQRGDLAAQFAILGGLRDSEQFIMERVDSMITIQELMENKVIGPWLAEKFDEGEASGFGKGERSLLRRQLEAKFGALPRDAADRLDSASESDLSRWALRVLEAKGLSQVFDGE